MPKTNIRGGNKKKRGKNGISDFNRTLDYAVKGQYYAQVYKILGSGRFMVKCYEKDTKTNEFILSEKICHVRGKMRKKVWVNDNDLVLISIREFDKTKGDILHKYTYYEAKKLIKHINKFNRSTYKTAVTFHNLLPATFFATYRKY